MLFLLIGGRHQASGPRWPAKDHTDRSTPNPVILFLGRALTQRSSSIPASSPLRPLDLAALASRPRMERYPAGTFVFIVEEPKITRINDPEAAPDSREFLTII